MAGAEMSAIRRVVRLLEEIAVRGGRIRFAEAAAVLAPIGPNTVARLLRELARAGVLERGRDRSYRLSDAPMFWAASVPRGRDLRALARPHLVALNRDLAATACVIAPYRRRLTIVDRITDQQSPSLLPPGEFAPLEAVFIGAPFLMPRARLEDLDDVRRALAAHAPRARFDAAGARRAFLAAVDAGVWLDPGELFPAVHRVSAPVRRGDEIVACLGLGAASANADARWMARAGERIAGAAAALSKRLAQLRDDELR